MWPLCECLQGKEIKHEEVIQQIQLRSPQTQLNPTNISREERPMDRGKKYCTMRKNYNKLNHTTGARSFRDAWEKSNKESNDTLYNKRLHFSRLTRKTRKTTRTT